MPRPQMTGVYTYQDLLEYLQALSPAQRQQRIQFCCAPPDGDEPHPLQEVICVGTVAEFEIPTRGAFDNQHHPAAIILMGDVNPFSPDGTYAYDITDADEPPIPKKLEERYHENN